MNNNGYYHSIVCPIFFETLKTPMYLSCKHLFCNDCLFLDNAVLFLRDNAQMNSILNKVNTFQQQLIKIKIAGGNNISEIENAVDNYVAKTEKGRERLRRDLDKLEDGSFCLISCKREIEQTLGTENENGAVLKFASVKDKLRKMMPLNSASYTKLHLS